ncbi:aminotransferase class IV [Maribacter hydrothermalis]|uniref:branched-chain-amino-acid transaminase n=1 Tax=Maribacter hydrothermalis TaxID=1836467 RepID=A0A1B7Z9C6_9FLAO|nr:aminotransferase class IV [Maribacter hydrothermalis]APQ18816.1 aminotransferase class IV [Maribacter hydrothermalis]OBR39170.1 aminotransferase class IV [Maribacter hydrothermalis]
MLNFNGKLLNDNDKILNASNRALQFGDAVFEELRVVNGEAIFLEDHYLRLMSSMRILRMEIPMNFTMEFFEEEILRTLSEQDLKASKGVKFIVYRNNNLDENSISYVITTCSLVNPFYILTDSPYEVELFKDFYKNSSMLSNLDTNNKILNVVGGIYADENDYQDCLLINEHKQVIETLKGNLFIVQKNVIKTAPLVDGCVNGIIRGKLIDIVKKIEDYQFVEESISPFELQKADELFTVNSFNGIISITKYRKKNYDNTVAKALIGKLNTTARFSLVKPV